jgi:hypothetical protein
MHWDGGMQSEVLFPSEAALYASWIGDATYKRRCAEAVIEQRLELQQEIQNVIRCHDLPGVVRCVGVVITEEVRIQVKGMLMEFLSKGDLVKLCW